MNILVLNGSPKGKNSITLQTILYLEQCFKKHRFEILHAGQQIRSLEKDFTPAVQAIERADLILFSYPVYTFIVPYQLHRFMELLKSSGMDLSGKYVTQLSTSKHFYDVTAHRFIQDNCQDLGMKYIRGLSADMEDLTTEKGRRQARDFFRFVRWSVQKDFFEPIPGRPANFAPDPVHRLTPDKTASNTTEKASKKEVVIVTDCDEKDVHLLHMIDRFRAVLPSDSRVVNLREYPFAGGCLGCFHCAADGTCVYKDGFDTFLRENIQSGDAIVYAFSIKDHSMGSRFKLYDDRQFCNGHRTVTMGMPMAYIISGPYSREMNLQTIIEARAQVGGNMLAGIATDEQNSDRSIDQAAQALAYALEHRLQPPANFYGVGGMKIFRDLIFMMQGLMKADHRFYKAHGQYDFPQKHMGRVAAMYLVGAMMTSPKIRAKMGSKMTEGMLMPYAKVIENAKKGKF